MWRRLTHGIRNWRRPDQADRDLCDEVEHFLEAAAQDLIAQGVAPAEARRQVRLTYGDALTARDDVRSSSWESVAQDFFGDVRLAARRLRRTPTFTTTVALVLGLGIGATTAIVSVVRPVLFDPLPYPQPERIVSIADRTSEGGSLPATYGTFLELRSRVGGLQSLAGHKPWQATLAGAFEAERIDGQRVSSTYFDALGVLPAFGPGFDAAEDRPGGEGQVVLSHALWERRFEADPQVVGSAVRFDRESLRVVGVMPASFQDVTRPTAEAWALLQYGATADWNTREWGHHLEVLGRIAEGATAAGVRASVGEVAADPIDAFPRPPWASLADGMSVTPLGDAVYRSTRPAGWVLLGGVALLLAIACVDLGILLIGRGLGRRDELAVRAALGAGRGRLMRQLTTESLVLAGLGGLVAVAFAWGLGDLFTAMAPPALIGAGEVSLDRAAVGFAVALTGVVGLASGVLPAWLSSADRPTRSGRGNSAPGQLLTRALIAAEVALAFVLVVGAGLLVRTMSQLHGTDTGFAVGTQVVMRVHANGLPGGDAEVNAFWEAARQAVADVPGVRSAATTSQLPLSGDIDGYGITLDEPGRADGVDGSAYRYAVSPDYLAAMGIDVLEGRGLGPEDVAGGPASVLVSRSLADRVFGDGPVLGRAIRIGAGGGPFTVVGVVEDVTQESLAGPDREAVYVTPEQWHWADRVRWIVADVVDPSAVEHLRAAVASVNRDQPVARVASLETVVASSESERTFVMRLTAAFAVFATLLASVGLYGVLTSVVARRTREMGIRAALGATRSNLVGMVVGQGMVVATLGLLVGVGLSLLASRLLASLLFGVSTADPVTYVAAAVLFAAVCLTASTVPAVRAARSDPLQSLGAE